MRDYLARLRERGDLLVVEKEIDPFHELAAVTFQAQKRWGKPILFTRVKGSRFPVVTNVYGSRDRLAEVIGIRAADFCRQWSNLSSLGSGTGDQPPFTHVEDDDLIECKLSDLPLITYSDRDGAPYFTSAMFLAKDPETGVGNLSFHRSMYVSDNELRCRLAPRHHLTIYHEKAEKMGKPLEAAMLIGAPATSFLTAAAPLPYDVDELEVAARLKGSPIAMRKCRHIDLEVPADTEIVIEGRFLPDVRRPEGPFGEFMGYYVPVGPNAVFEVLGVTVRPNAVFHSILCGSAEEVLTLELSVSANIYQRLSAALPGIVDVTCQPFVTHAIIKIDPQFEGHARQVMLSTIGAEPIWAKVVTVVDEDVDIYNMDDVMWAILTRCRPDKDMLIIPETPSFYRDEQRDHWGRLLIDATKPFNRQGEFERKKIRLADQINLADWFPNADRTGHE
ncbi:ubiD decarboxylase family protein [Paraburkholderia xenovorans LB400]|uniref:Carboxylyase-related protein n=1 Tax=Paraburkholderia xenovorans (strain LB400) TaxID=266265 RepID=Q13FV8_PARXL|nr:UbiD family decarboxylase [Paraburkholderia xenovorans]ABE37031.1 Carboxylyase-related protein [Paraburkholderia xenovorans LB400]AIP34116.1 ubiD decarboxylase family protein [Paraburkholderia xenovorans LB400]